MSIIIKKATDNEKESVLALGRKIVDVYERTHLGDNIANEYLNSGACDRDLSGIYDNATVAIENGNVVGFIYTHENEIQGLSVDVPYWGKGIAQKLLAYATNELFNEYTEIMLECFTTSPMANRFYQKMGFVSSGIVKGDGGNRIVYKRVIRGDELTPKQVLLNWIDIFNHAKADSLADLYHVDATNHQVVTEPVVGKKAIHKRFVEEFELAEMVCIPENIFEDDEWAIMEWKDPKGFRGCGFFHIINGKIKFQRGYMDKLSFLKMNNLPIE